MELVAGAMALLVSGLVIGSIARFAVPGPDPLPIWKTIALGIAGSFVGGLVFGVAGLMPEDASQAGGAYFVAAVAGATAVLLLHRRFVQKRPITGPDAKLRPGRTAALVELEELVRQRDAGRIDAAEFERRKDAIVARI